MNYTCIECKRDYYVNTNCPDCEPDYLSKAAPKQNRALREIDEWLIEHPDISDDPQLHIIHIHIQDALAKAEGK